MLRAVDQPKRRSQHNRARALGSDERARDVKAILGQELIEVVARYASRDLREPGAYALRILVSNRPKRGVNRPAAPAFPNDRLQFLFRRRADRQLRSVVQQDRQVVHVVDGLAGEQRVRAARVVADHPAEAAAAVCRRVRAECQLVALCSCSKRIQDHAGLDAGNTLLDIHLENAIHVLREVEHDCDVAALTGQARAGAAGEYRRLERSAHGDRGADVVFVAWHDNTDGYLPVVRGVGGVKRPAAAIEAHFAAHGAPELAVELGGASEGVDRFSVRTERKRCHRPAGARVSGAPAPRLLAPLAAPRPAPPLGQRRQRFHRSLHATGFVGHTCEPETHLDAAERSRQHQVVERSQMADAEDAPGQLSESCSERHVEMLEDDLSQPVGVMAFRSVDRRQRARVLRWILGDDVESPGAHGGAGRRAMPRVAGENVLETFLVKHPQRLSQAVQQVGRRRIGEESRLVRLQHLVPVPIGLRERRLRVCRERFFRDRVEAESRRHHEPLLRSADGDVDLPLVVAEVDRGQR